MARTRIATLRCSRPQGSTFYLISCLSILRIVANRVSTLTVRPGAQLCKPSQISKFFVSVRLEERLLLGFVNHGAKTVQFFRGRRLRAQQGDHDPV
jgi:hypothetical protein